MSCHPSLIGWWFGAPAAGGIPRVGANSKGNFIGNVFTRYDPSLM